MLHAGGVLRLSSLRLAVNKVQAGAPSAAISTPTEFLQSISLAPALTALPGGRVQLHSVNISVPPQHYAALVDALCGGVSAWGFTPALEVRLTRSSCPH